MGSIVTRGASEDRRSRQWWLWSGMAVVLLLALARLLPDTAPESDYAVIDLSVLNVLHGAQPVGMYSRFGWHHPGPLYFELLSPAYWLSGYRHFSVNLTVAAINISCIFGIIAMLRRQTSSAALLIAGGVFGGAYLAGALMLMASPWNPHVVLLPLALLIVASATVACGELRFLPLVALAASFVVQTHIGPTLCVIAVATIATLIGAVRVKGAWRSPLLLTLVVLAVAWAPPLIDEFRSNGLHNLRAIAHFLQQSTPASTAQAKYAFAYFFIAPFSPHLGLSWGPLAPAPQFWIPALATLLAVLLVLTTIRSAWRRQTFHAMLGTLTIAGTAAAYLSVQRLPETPKDYTVMWVAILGVASWALVGAAAVEWLGVRSVGRRTMTIGIALLAIVTTVHVSVRRIRDQRIAEWVNAVTTPVDAAMRDAGVSAVLVHVPQSLWGRAAGVVLHLAREGKSPRVDPDWVTMFGRQYASIGDEPAEISFVESDEHTLLRLRTDELLLGKTDNLFVYFRAPLASRIASAAVTIEQSRETIGDLQTGLTFIGPEAFAQFALPDIPAIGVRLQGQGATRWHLACVGGDVISRIGSVTIPSGEGPRTADAFLKYLPGCRHLRIYATSQSVTQRLSGFQLLTR